MPMDDLMTECLDGLQDQLGPIDWNRPTSYRVDRQ
jgi:hypothetical protein